MRSGDWTGGRDLGPAAPIILFAAFLTPCGALGLYAGAGVGWLVGRPEWAAVVAALLLTIALAVNAKIPNKHFKGGESR